jgi:hypothetical protein
MKILLCVLPLLCPLLSGQSRFNGTWEMKMDTIQLSGPPEEYLLQNGKYHCLTCAPRVDVAMNGADQNTTGHANFNTISIRIVNANSVEFIQKKDGKLTFTCTETVSSDGKTMVEDFSETPTSRSITGQATFVRLASGPPGSHALSGSWQMQTIRNVSKSGPISTYEAVVNGMRISGGGPAYEAQFDGKDYPAGVPGRSVSLKLIDENTIEQTEKQHGKIVRTARMTVSKDGHSMKVESTDQQRGGRMTYSAEKKP